jgi:CheY-like chemotaxis protein
MADRQSTRADAILVVDDDADNREMLVEDLQAKASGRSAWTATV